VEILWAPSSLTVSGRGSWFSFEAKPVQGFRRRQRCGPAVGGEYGFVQLAMCIGDMPGRGCKRIGKRSFFQFTPGLRRED